MVLDPIAEVLYLFGGWDGNQDLSDLWSYDIAAGKWTLICKDTEAVVGVLLCIYTFWKKNASVFVFLSRKSERLAPR